MNTLYVVNAEASSVKSREGSRTLHESLLMNDDRRSARTTSSAVGESIGCQLSCAIGIGEAGGTLFVGGGSDDGSVVAACCWVRGPVAVGVCVW